MTSAESASKNSPKTPAEKLLVISDNADWCDFLQTELARLSFAHPLRVDYRYTRYTTAPETMIALGAGLIDLKDANTIANIVKDYDLVFSLHCKQIFPPALVEGVCCVNFHPGLNPFNRGWFPQAFSILNGLPTGATIHIMDADIDHGAIIAQQPVEISVSDTSLEVYQKINAAEKQLLRENIFRIIEGTFETRPPVAEGNYNSVKDYKKLCALDLSDVATFKQHLDVLRATSHGPFKNAYFVDEAGQKYFVRIQIEPEFSVRGAKP